MGKQNSEAADRLTAAAFTMRLSGSGKIVGNNIPIETPCVSLADALRECETLEQENVRLRSQLEAEAAGAALVRGVSAVALRELEEFLGNAAKDE